eukprot:TRINITY_DN3131_c0_g1_i1.p1 TRINITY_DN3131_c0_g1~~TRINITY_DN3131_c0_g1_i1.p1  ORF type:complete len:518 (-),score=128.70 TRINITY_DN3131_c0_g1_i1:56-1609(-)
MLGSVICLLLFAAPAFGQKWTQHNGMRWGPGYNNPFNFQARLPGLFRIPKPADQASWENLWAGVSDYDGEVPPQEAVVQYAYGYTVRPNDTATVGLLSFRPQVTWPADPDALYTIMIVDNGIQRVLPKGYIHWMVVNIPGNNIPLGNEVMDYVTPFSFEIKDGKIDPDGVAHPMLVMIYKQQGEILMEETRQGCSEEILSSIYNTADLASKYEMELVAGTFFNVPYSGKATDEMLCRITKCDKKPFPFPMPGKNDGPECEPRKDVMDVTLRGPVLSKIATYSKYTSLYYPGSFINLIRSTYPAVSTGVIREFRVVEGEFEGGDSLTETLEGDVNVAMLVYQSPEAGLQLFNSSTPQAREILQKVLPALSTNGDYKVLFVQPHDQDFDVNIVARDPENLIVMNMVKVKPGQGEKFQEIRKSVVARARNNKHVMSVHTFNVVNGALESLPKDNLFNFDSTNNQFMLTFYKDKEEREKALDSIPQDAEFVEYLSTFDCIACAVINNDLDPSYYPPFPQDP